MTSKEYQEYHYQASVLWRELAHQEQMALIYLSGLKLLKTSTEYSDKLKLCREKMEQIKTQITELKKPSEAVPDIIGTAITEPEEIEQHEFIMFKNIAIGESFYSENLSQKYIKTLTATTTYNARNVVSGELCFFGANQFTYQRIKLDTESKFIEELRGDFTTEELKNYQPK